MLKSRCNLAQGRVKKDPALLGMNKFYSLPKGLENLYLPLSYLKGFYKLVSLKKLQKLRTPEE